MPRVGKLDPVNSPIVLTSGGPLLRNNSGTVEARVNANNAYAPFQAAGITGTTGAFSGIFQVTNNTASTTTTTGALQITGGLGVGGDVNAGGSVTASVLIGSNGIYSSNSNCHWVGSWDGTNLRSQFRIARGITDFVLSTTAQELNIFNTTSNNNYWTGGTNYERANIGWRTNSNWFAIATDAAGTGSNRGILLAPANSIVAFGGTSSSFPALKRSSTALHVRLADDSAFASLEASTITVNTAVAFAGSAAATTRSNLDVYSKLETLAIFTALS